MAARRAAGVIALLSDRAGTGRKAAGRPRRGRLARLGLACRVRGSGRRALHLLPAAVRNAAGHLRPAANALQAWDMLHGNWLLTRWTLTAVSFYTTELPEYVLVEVFRGLGPADVHIAAAVTYTLLVILAGLLAKGNKTGTEGMLRVLIASGIMIAPQVGHGVFIVLLAPDHTGTAVPVLLTWLVLDRAPRRGWVPPFIGLMLTWTLLGDRVALLTAVAPLLLVTAARSYQLIIARREPVNDSWYELSLAAAALGSVALSGLIGVLIRHLGGFTLQSAPSAFSSVESMSVHFWWVVQ